MTPRLPSLRRAKKEPVWAVPRGDKDFLTVAVLGDTGVGKSSLINAALGEDRATVGLGAPVLIGPAGAAYYASADAEFAFWDFEGFHHGSKAAPAKTLKRQLTAIAQGIPTRRIDAAWFCWQASSARLTDGHRRLLAVLRQQGIPTLGVLTKVHATGMEGGAEGGGIQVSAEHARFAEWLGGGGTHEAGLGLTGGQIFLTAARADAELGLVTHGLDALLEATRRVAQESGARPT